METWRVVLRELFLQRFSVENASRQFVDHWFEGNWAIPTWSLADDRRVCDLGVQFHVEPLE